MSNLDALRRDVTRLEGEVQAAADHRTNLRESARDPRLTRPARASLERQAAAADRRHRKLSGDLRMAKARVREAERRNR